MEIIVKAAEDDKVAQKVKADIQSLIKIAQEHLDLNLDDLELVAVPSDFYGDLTAFQLEHGLPAEYTHTNGVQAVAKTIHYQVNGRDGTAIFIHPVIVNCMYTEGQIGEAMVTIVHELCHVHDGQNQRRIFEPAFHQNLGPHTVSFKMHRFCVHVWEEYYACRRASFAFINPDTGIIDEHGLLIKELLNDMSCIRDEIQNQIHHHPKDGDISQMICILIERVVAFLSLMSRVQGHLDGLKSDHLDERLANALKDSHFEEAWGEMGEELRNLYDKYPDWVGEKEFEQLGYVVQSVFHIMGIYPMDIEDEDGNGVIWWGLPGLGSVA